MAENDNKLYRFPQVGWLGGVCAGIAYKLKIQTWSARLAWSLTSLFWFPLILVYIGCWIFMPKADTPKDYKEVCD